MARRRGVWAELQRDMSRRHREQERARRAAVQAGLRAQREHEKRRRAAARQAAADERELKRLHIQECKDEAAAMTADVEATIAELDSVLSDGLDHPPETSFDGLRRDIPIPPFDPAGLDRPQPAPRWEDYAPQPPSLMRRVTGSARYRREELASRQEFEQQAARHSLAEAARRKELSQRRSAYNRTVAETTAQHVAGIDLLEKEYQAGDPEAVARFVAMALEASIYPEGFPDSTPGLIYDPEPRHLVVDHELPPQAVIPAERSYRYVQTRDETDVVARPVKEIKDRYRSLISQVALRVLHEVFAADAPGVIEVVTFNGRVSTIDKATGQPVRPHLISVSVSRERFDALVLQELDPVMCLRHLNALISAHPYDLEAVKPMVDFEALLSKYKFVEGMDALVGLDSRPDLLDMTPTEFEHLTRQLFEAMGMKSWVTQASKDDGVDAVATNEDPVFGGLCIIQAKRYSGAVGVEAVRALAGVMEDKHATKGILFTTSWVTSEGHAFASRHGRIQVMEGKEVKYLCHTHLGLDVLIGLPKPAPSRRR